MRSQKSNLVFITILASVFLGLLIPGALADTDIIKPLSTEPANTAYATETGQFYDNVLFLPLVDDNPTVSGIMFHGLNVTQDEYINNATLGLYFALGPQAGEAVITCYGIRSRIQTNHGFYSSSDLLNAELTGALVNMNLSAISSDGWQYFDVTQILQEIVNREWWVQFDNVGLVFLSTGGEPRAVTTNNWIASRFPFINVTYGEAPPGAGQNFTQYEGYTITRGETSKFVGYVGGTAGGNATLFWLPPGENPISPNWVNQTLPYAWGPLPGGVNAGFTFNDKLYLVVEDTLTTGDLISVNLTDDMTPPLASQFVGNMGGYYQNGIDVFWDDENEVGHYVYIDTGGIYYYNFTLDPFSKSAKYTLWVGGPSYSGQGVDIEVDSAGNIYVLGSTRSPASSNLKTRFCFKPYGQNWETDTISLTQTQNYYPRITLLDGDYIVTITDGQGSSAQTKWNWGHQGNNTFAGSWNNLAGTSSKYVHPHYSDQFVREGFFSGSQYLLDVVMYVGARADVDYRTGSGYIYKTAPNTWTDSNVIEYTAMANRTGRDNRWPVHVEYGNYIQSLFIHEGQSSYFIGNPEQWSGTKTIDQWGDRWTGLSSNAHINTASITTGSRTTWIVTPPPNGTDPDPTCLELAETEDDVIACINQVLPGGVPPSDDPDPPGWPEDGPVTRPRIILYYLILGLTCIIGPVLYLAKTRNFEYLYPVLFVVFVGVALLLATRYV